MQEGCRRGVRMDEGKFLEEQTGRQDGRKGWLDLTLALGYVERPLTLPHETVRRRSGPRER